MNNLRVDAERLWNDLMQTAEIGATPEGGISRLSLTEPDRQARDWFKARAESFGCIVTIDDMGVMFARRAGQRPDIPPIAMGSHLDSQSNGGKFDGALGVVAALETLRTLHDAGYETYASVEVVNWTNKEGARFTPAMGASGVFAGVFARDWVANGCDRAGVRFGNALDAVGYRGAEACGAHPLSAFFELHIEQGPYLEQDGKDIGVVTSVQAMRWYEVKVTGHESNAGTTPMLGRHDALVGAARLVTLVDTIARAHAPYAVGTVGVLETRTGSTNLVPGDVFLTIDLRHPEMLVLDQLESDITAAAEAISREPGLEVAVKTVWNEPPVRFAASCTAAIHEAAAASGYSARDIVSAAGHDAAYVARVAPTAMIFVPCRGGISHNAAEFASKEQCAAGAQVLLQTVVNYDRKLAANGGGAV